MIVAMKLIVTLLAISTWSKNAVMLSVEAGENCEDGYTDSRKIKSLTFGANGTSTAAKLQCLKSRNCGNPDATVHQAECKNLAFGYGFGKWDCAPQGHSSDFVIIYDDVFCKNSINSTTCIRIESCVYFYTPLKTLEANNTAIYMFCSAILVLCAFLSFIMFRGHRRLESVTRRLQEEAVELQPTDETEETTPPQVSGTRHTDSEPYMTSPPPANPGTPPPKPPRQYLY